MPAAAPPRTIACLLYANCMSLDVTGPMQVFATANDVAQHGHRRPAPYRLQLLAETPAPVATSAGFRLVPDEAWSALALDSVDTLLVPGGDGVIAQRGNRALLDLLRRAAPLVRRLGSVCSGALLLAEAGLLDGRRATSHWSRLEQLRERHPAVRVEPDCLHTFDPDSTEDGHVFTSAGVTAGIDLALALVEADLGRPMALAVARQLVMFLRRPGGQAQFSALLAPEPRRTPRLAALLDWLPGQLGDDLSLERLAG